MNKFLSTIAVALIVSGCASNKTWTYFDVNSVSAVKDYAVVVFYRPNQMYFVDDLFTVDGPKFQEYIREEFYELLEKETTPIIVEDKWTVVVDDKPDTKLSENEFFIKNIKAGPHTFNARSDRFDIVKEFNLQAGKVYFFSVTAESHTWLENVTLNSGPYVRISEQSKEYAAQHVVHMKQVLTP